MPRKTRRRLAAVAAASGLGHVLVLAILAFQHPRPLSSFAPPLVFDVTVAPLYLVEPRARARAREAPAPIRPRRARTLPDEATPVAPLYAAPATGRTGPGPAQGVGIETHPGPQPPGTQAELGRALKFGGVGCDSPDLVRMTPQERDRCAERFGAGAKTATYLGQGLSRDKQGLLDAAAARKEAYRKYRDSPMPPGLSTSGAAGGMTGLGDTAHGADPNHRF